MLLEAELLGRSEAVRPLLPGVRAAAQRKLDSVHRECTDGGLAAVRSDKGADWEFGHLRSGRDPQPGHGEEAPEGHDDRARVLHDHLFRVLVLVG